MHKTLTNENILVTGGSGFLGSNLVENLNKHCDNVYSLTKNYNKTQKLYSFKKDITSKFIVGSITDVNEIIRIIEDYKITIVYHLAANNNNIDSTEFYDIYETNIRGTYSIIEACRHISSIKLLVFSSSEEVYSVLNNSSNQSDLYNPYTISKSASELMLNRYSHDYNKNVAIVRMSNLYGEGDLNFRRLIPYLCDSIIHKHDFELRSTGKNLRDYLYIKDAVQAYAAITYIYLNQSLVGHHCFNLASEHRSSALEIVSILKSIAIANGEPYESTLARIYTEDANERAGIQYDLSKQKYLLDWKSTTTLSEGLNNTYIWYQRYFDTYHLA